MVEAVEARAASSGERRLNRARLLDAASPQQRLERQHVADTGRQQQRLEWHRAGDGKQYRRCTSTEVIPTGLDVCHRHCRACVCFCPHR